MKECKILSYLCTHGCYKHSFSHFDRQKYIKRRQPSEIFKHDFLENKACKRNNVTICFLAYCYM